MTSLFERIRSIFAKPEAPAPAPIEPVEDVVEDDRLRVLVGKQKAISRGRGSMNEAEGLVRDAL